MTKQEKIKRLKQRKNAVILAHYYVDPEIQEAADYVGDSYYLSKIAADLPHEILVFCGVAFMGESAKLLSPGKTVLMPSPDADCPMAHMVTGEDIQKVRRKYDDVAVVCYVNSTAEIKSWSDVCVTSANAIQIVKNLPNHNIFFIPDKNLARYVAAHIPEKNIIIHDGYCPIHEKMNAEEIVCLKKAHLQAPVLVHPECNQVIIDLADYVGSTSGIINFCENSDKDEFIIATECGILYELKKKRPDAAFYFPETVPLCRDMKKITLEQIINVLETGENEVHIDPSFTAPSAGTLVKMLELSKEKR